MSRLKVVARKVGIRAFIFLSYLFLGAGIFLGIERKAKLERINEMDNRYNASKWKLMQDYGINATDMENFKILIEDLVRGGYFKKKSATEWNFVNAFFFSGNVVTTIGYGHIAPLTVAGRLICILYAIIGIPLAGYFLRTVGNELTNLFAFSIKYLERRIYNREAEKIEMKSAIFAFLLANIWLLFGAAIFSTSESDWTFVDAFYFSFITLTTIGFGDLVPGLSRDGRSDVGVHLAVEMAALIYYVIGLSVVSGVILSLSNYIEEKTKKFDMQDPMDAIRNLRIENLNTKAMKKLGYKMTNGPLDEMTHYNLNTRRGTIVPDDMAPRRVSKLFEDTQRERTTNKNLVPPIYPNGTLTRKGKSSDGDENGMTGNQPIVEEKSGCSPHKDDQTTEVDNILEKMNNQGLDTNNSVIVDVDVSPSPSRRPSSGRPLSANSLAGIKRLKAKHKGTVEPSYKRDEQRQNKSKDCATNKIFTTWKEPPDGNQLSRNKTQVETKPKEYQRRGNDIGLPSEIFAASIHNRQRKVLERTASESHTDEIEYNDIMEEILKEHLETKKTSIKIIKNKGVRSPTPEFLSLTKQFSQDSDCHVESNNHTDDSAA